MVDGAKFLIKYFLKWENKIFNNSKKRDKHTRKKMVAMNYSERILNLNKINLETVYNEEATLLWRYSSKYSQLHYYGNL